MTSVRLTRACGVLQRTFQSHVAASSAAVVTASASLTTTKSTIVNNLDHVLFSTRLSFSSSSSSSAATAATAQKTNGNSAQTNYTKDQDASTFMAGVTNEDVANNPTLSAFFQANFPEYFKAGNNNNNKEQDSSGDSGAVDPDAAKLATFIKSELEREKEEKQLLKQKRQSSTPLLLRSPVSTPLQESKKEKHETETENEQIITTTPPNNIRPLWCYTRQKGAESGSRRCQELRNQPSGSALVPGILYGSDPTKGILSTDASSKTLVKTPWKLLQCELDRYTYHHFESRVYDLTIYSQEDNDDDDDGDGNSGTIHRVMPRDVQYHPILHKVYCCNYLRYFPGKPISIPIEYINTEESAAMKRGGFIAPITRHVTCIVEDGVPIPEKIELECTGVKLKEVIREERLIFPEGVSMSPTVNRELFLVGTVFGRSSEVDEEDVVATEGEEEVKSGDA